MDTIFRQAVNLKQCRPKRRGVYRVCLVVLVASFIGGCVSDEVKQDNPLTAYQQRLTERGPQKRAEEDSIEQLKPRPNSRLAALDFSVDPNTGEKTCRLSVEQAITQLLSNSPEIRIVSYDPSISREDITKSAAEFDYTLFGELKYNDNDKPNNQNPGFWGTIPEGGLSESRFWQAGIKKNTVIGSEWSLAWALTRKWDNSAYSRLNTRYEPMFVFQLTQPLLRNAGKEFNLAELNISKLNYHAAFAFFRQRAEELAVEVISTYWELVRSKQDLEIRQRLLQNTQETLQTLLDRQEIDATAVQIKQVESSLESRRADLLQAEKRIKDMRDSLIRLVSNRELNLLEETEIIPTSDPVIKEPELADKPALTEAMLNNPTIQQRRLELKVANLNIDIAENQELPILDLVFSSELQGFAKDYEDARRGLYDVDYDSYTIGLSFEYPLGNRGREAELRRRELQHAKAISRLNNTSDRVAVQVKMRIRKVETAYQEVQAQAKAVKAAQSQLQALEDAQLIRGQLSPEFLLVKLQAQADLARAEQSRILAIANYNTALAELAEAKGTVLELNQVASGLKAVSRAESVESEG